MHPRLALRSLALALLATPAAAAPPEVLDIAPVWSGHPVGFALLTDTSRQYVAYYDADRNMTVASRPLDSAEWTRQILPSKVGWDSHNYITLALDDNGDLHVSGNMHGHPLVYFRTTTPGDVTTLTKLPMTGQYEAKCTYPKFFRGPNNQLLFNYRDGSSGNGNHIYNAYHPKTRTWSPLLNQPLTDGEGQRNAYPVGPALGPDGLYHLVWVWRETPDCSTNHTLSYARSKDLRTWTKADGTPLSLPMTLSNSDVVDPVPEKGGMINGNTALGFDSQKRPVITYHKFDADGHTQLYNARFESGRWNVVQATDWTYRWDFSGGGSIQFEIGVSPVRPRAAGFLTQSYSHAKHGPGSLTLDESTLKPTTRPVPSDPKPAKPRPADNLGPVESPVPGMGLRTARDAGRPPKGTRYILRWETLPVNRDRPHPGPPPAPSMLRLYKFTD